MHYVFTQILRYSDAMLDRASIGWQFCASRHVWTSFQAYHQFRNCATEASHTNRPFTAFVIVIFGFSIYVGIAVVLNEAIC
ncbi:hypothetical protein T02_5596 [Trichinella nativa]|uniref:Uncharacterized protein n=1 Tax=Trichinella nativa TaxID=6335 RepID=A0A0V1LEM2_9BILA|nr:hypothetical protein T02_5596 [Trichinella nativa]KRZ97446.1 hypothetical protein T08_11047 [Trichinella sp. T8]